MAMEFLRTEMGMKIHETTKAQALITDLSNEEKGIYTMRFQSIDQERKGFISISDIRRSLRVWHVSFCRIVITIEINTRKCGMYLLYFF